MVIHIDDGDVMLSSFSSRSYDVMFIPILPYSRHPVLISEGDKVVFEESARYLETRNTDINITSRFKVTLIAEACACNYFVKADFQYDCAYLTKINQQWYVI